MKLATYRWDDRQSFGVLGDGGVLDIPRLWPDGPASLLAALQAGPDAMENIARLARDGGRPPIPLDQVALLAPIPQPPKVLGLAGNYVEHIRECIRDVDLPDDPKSVTTPRPFLMPATAVIGPGAEIPWPAYSEQIDHEIELAIVMGAEARRITPGQARDRIAGYTIANDVSARSTTHAEGRTPRPRDPFFDWLHGKWADGFCPTGPWLVTPDEIGDPGSLRMELTVNGQVRQQANTSQMIYNVFEVVSFLSHVMTLVPGDLIATGTVPGVAMASGKWLQAGDVIACRIERVGELSNTLGARPKRFYSPCVSGLGD